MPAPAAKRYAAERVRDRSIAIRFVTGVIEVRDAAPLQPCAHMSWILVVSSEAETENETPTPTNTRPSTPVPMPAIVSVWLVFVAWTCSRWLRRARVHLGDELLDVRGCRRSAARRGTRDSSRRRARTRGAGERLRDVEQEQRIRWASCALLVNRRRRRRRSCACVSASATRADRRIFCRSSRLLGSSSAAASGVMCEDDEGECELHSESDCVPPHRHRVSRRFFATGSGAGGATRMRLLAAFSTLVGRARRRSLSTTMTFNRPSAGDRRARWQAVPARGIHGRGSCCDHPPTGGARRSAAARECFGDVAAGPTRMSSMAHGDRPQPRWPASHHLPPAARRRARRIVMSVVRVRRARPPSSSMRTTG